MILPDAAVTPKPEPTATHLASEIVIEYTEDFLTMLSESKHPSLRDMILTFIKVKLFNFALVSNTTEIEKLRSILLDATDIHRSYMDGAVTKLLTFHPSYETMVNTLSRAMTKIDNMFDIELPNVNNTMSRGEWLGKLLHEYPWMVIAILIKIGRPITYNSNETKPEIGRAHV